MARAIETISKSINLPRLLEELQATILPPFNLTPGGFEKITNRQWAVAAEPRLITRRAVKGKPVFEDFANPGELWLQTENPLTTEEATVYSSTVAAHDFNNLSNEQQREDVDRVQLVQLKQTLADWDGLSNLQRMQEIKKILRLILRRYNEAV